MKSQFSGIPSDYVPLKGDASSRTYYRGRGHILVKYPADGAESFDNYLLWTKRYRAGGIQVPEILDVNRDRMEMSLEDWGDADGVAWFHQLDTFNEKVAFVRSVYRLIPLIQSLEQRNPGRAEKGIDVEWELNFFLDHAGDTIFKNLDISWLQPLCAEIVRILKGGDWKLAHRDYHFRNILVLNGKICVIDFQDTRMAPVFYDNVSLLFDNYLNLTEMASEVELRMNTPIFRWVALQRNLKALGTFAWFGYKQGKTWFRESVPLAMRHVASHLNTLGLKQELKSWKKLMDSVAASGYKCE
ncbi:MAG: phosphotransferase [Acidobacteria bacterium]|nr:phosphotransferase [Acidobacteriota bacterium]